MVVVKTWQRCNDRNYDMDSWITCRKAQFQGLNPVNQNILLLWLTVIIMLLGVLSFVDLAGGVVSFTQATSIRHSCGAQNMVTADSLWEKPKKKSILFTRRSNHGTASLLHVLWYYLTQSIYTDIRAVLWAECPIFNFAGQGEEEVVALSEAVQLAHILI